MRTLRTAFLLIVALTAFPSFAQRTQQAPATEDSRLALTKDVMNDMAGGQIAAVSARFTPDLKDSLTEDKLEFVWNRLMNVSGGFQKQISQSTRTIHGATAYVAKSQFEDSKVELRLTFDDHDRITHFWIGPVSDLSAETMESTAKDLVEQLHQKQFEQMSIRFTTELQVRMPPERLQMSWSHVVSHLGPFKNVKLVSKDEELDFVDVTCEFETGEIVVRVAFDPSGKIGGLWMIPVESAPDETPKV
jgi:hypothetical protein